MVNIQIKEDKYWREFKYMIFGGIEVIRLLSTFNDCKLDRSEIDVGNSVNSFPGR